MIEDCLPWVEKMAIFERFTPHERYMLASVSELVELGTGEELSVEGQAADAFYIVVKGRLRVERMLPTGEDVTLYTIGSERMVGMKALIDGNVRTTTLRAQGPTVVLSYPRAEFVRHFHAQSQYSFKMLDLIISQFTEQLRDADLALAQQENVVKDSDVALRSLIRQFISTEDADEPS